MGDSGRRNSKMVTCGRINIRWELVVEEIVKWEVVV